MTMNLSIPIKIRIDPLTKSEEDARPKYVNTFPSCYIPPSSALSYLQLPTTPIELQKAIWEDNISEKLISGYTRARA